MGILPQLKMNSTNLKKANQVILRVFITNNISNFTANYWRINHVWF
ncbi:hypothetical protein SPHINGO8BC_90452 [Sphingobacterium multivorum]|uniref:Uncharacterized protein n=1 Tax=Sphingobacterium multivorum TaxID=28454 RepID=A0A654E0F2_SPHMU|nr:hypothetical protein SPHINGO8BC_90452 [Sphingobacterium multivorum]